MKTPQQQIECPECLGDKDIIVDTAYGQGIIICPECKGTGKVVPRMNNQQQIEELVLDTAKYIAILRGLNMWVYLPVKQTQECGRNCQEACIREAKQILFNNNLAIIKDGELATNPYNNPGQANLHQVYGFAQYQMIKAGYKQVIPLKEGVEEK